MESFHVKIVFCMTNGAVSTWILIANTDSARFVNSKKNQFLNSKVYVPAKL
jgi:hypothetical protein